MKYKPAPSALFVKNRTKFYKQLPNRALAIFNSNDIYPISADSTFAFEQHRDIFYLSGIDQNESILLLFPDATNPQHREILFLTKTNPQIAVWEGAKLTKEQARAISGIETIYWLDAFESVFQELIHESDVVFLNKNEHYRSVIEVETREDRFINKIKQRYPLHRLGRSNPILQRLRSVKEPEEINCIQSACDITEKGFRSVLTSIKPGIIEYEIEAVFAYEFLRRGSKGFAYSPIIASGVDNNILHYTQNNKVCKDGELILMDVGAQYANYASDMTRTVPVNGRFTKRQRSVYECVLLVKNRAAEMLVPGNNWYKYHEEVGKIMTSTLLELKLLDRADVQNQNPQKPAYKKYFMHGTSHHIGLDTHDYGLLTDDFAPNMVFTVEPGIYIPQEGFGIRLEDDYVIQPAGVPKNLMKNIPIEIDEIESLMLK